MEKLTKEEYLQQLKEQGTERENWAFICPMCGTVQSKKDFIKAGVDEEKAEDYLGFSCIGRFTGAGSPKKNSGKPCNWTLGGLFQMHEVVVVVDGEEYPRFAVATKEQAEKHAKLFI